MTVLLSICLLAPIAHGGSENSAIHKPGTSSDFDFQYDSLGTSERFFGKFKETGSFGNLTAIYGQHWFEKGTGSVVHYSAPDALQGFEIYSNSRLFSILVPSAKLILSYRVLGSSDFQRLTLEPDTARYKYRVEVSPQHQKENRVELAYTANDPNSILSGGRTGFQLGHGLADFVRQEFRTGKSFERSYSSLSFDYDLGPTARFAPGAPKPMPKNGYLPNLEVTIGNTFDDETMKVDEVARAANITCSLPKSLPFSLVVKKIRPAFLTRPPDEEHHEKIGLSALFKSGRHFLVVTAISAERFPKIFGNWGVPIRTASQNGLLIETPILNIYHFTKNGLNWTMYGDFALEPFAELAEAFALANSQ